MENQHDIDNLFKDTLSGSVVSDAHSASAWQGANTLLNRHYRVLYYKKLALIGIPAIIGLTALTLFIVQDEIDATNAANVVIENPVGIETQASSTSENSALIQGKSASKVEPEPLVNDAASDNSKAGTTESRLSPEEGRMAIDSESSNDVNSSTPPAKKSSIKAATSVAQQSAPTVLANSMDEAENVQKNAIEVPFNDNMEWMPTFNVGKLNDLDHASTVLSRNKPAREALMQQLRRIELGVTAGGLVANGFQNTGTSRENPTIGWFGGVTAKLHINARLYAESGIVINGRSALASRKTESIALVGFIYSSSKNLMYADIPLRVGYNFGARHSVGFGMIFSPLVGYAPFTEATNIIEDPNEENPTITRNGSIARDGFANFDVAGSLNYYFQLTQRLDFTADARFGLFDVTDNQYFGTAIIDDRNHQLRIGLNYRFISR